MARKSRKHVAPDIAVPEAESMVFNAAAYIRLSSDAKRKPGDSLENQRDIIENHIATMADIHLVKVYCDNQTTGTNFERPAFQRMLRDAESGVINCIIVKDLTRFGRSAIDSGFYIEKHLPALGVRFIAVTDSFDSIEGDGGIMLPLKNLIAESYALDISRKCRSVQRQNIQEGRFVGRLAPYGFNKSPEDCRKLVIDEEAAVVVRMMFEWAAGGMGIGEIVRTLNDKGILTPSRYKAQKGLITNKTQIGKPYWHKRVVENLLGDRVYVGDMVQGKTRKVDHKQKAVPPDEWVCVPNTHEPVISRELFEQVQANLQGHKDRDKAARGTAVPYTPHIFKGKVFCAHCGNPMHRHRQNKDGTYWYRCESQWKYHKDACYQVSVKETDLKDEMFFLLNTHSEVILGSHIQMERNIPLEIVATDTELAEINRRLSASGHFLKTLYENLLEDIITEDEFAAMKEDYEGKINSLSKRANEIRAIRRDGVSAREARTDFVEATAEALSDGELTADVIDRLVEKVLVNRDKSVEIILRFRDEFREVKRVG